VLVLSVSVVLLLREEGGDRLDQPLSTMAPSAPDGERLPEPSAAAPKLERTPGVPARSGDAPPPLRSATAPRPQAVEEDRRKDQPAAEVTQAPSRAAGAPHPEPQPFTEPPSLESRRAMPGAAPPAQTSPLAREMEPGTVAGARQRAATAAREQVPGAPAPPPPATVPDAALGGQEAKPRPALPESSNRMEQKLRDDMAPAVPRPPWEGFERQAPEKWLERVDELRRAGRDEEAREMLAEFRRRFPQFPVPAALDR
jgi:hypothetical protein